jgi:hypothetical protein
LRTLKKRDKYLSFFYEINKKFIKINKNLFIPEVSVGLFLYKLIQLLYRNNTKYKKELREMIKEIEKLIEEMMKAFLLKEEDLELEIVKLI